MADKYPSYFTQRFLSSALGNAPYQSNGNNRYLQALESRPNANSQRGSYNERLNYRLRPGERPVERIDSTPYQEYNSRNQNFKGSSPTRHR